MKAKRIFWRDGHSEIPAAPCPFVGVTIKSYDDFVHLLQDRLFHFTDKENKKGYYPPVIFPTKDRKKSIAFRGSYGFSDSSIPVNPKTGKQYKWAIIDEDSLKVVRYFSIQDSFDEIVEMFKDDDKVQKQIDEFIAIAKRRDCGIIINTR